MEYRVRWEIDVDADTPEEAAIQAAEIQADAGSTATVFDVKPLTKTDYADCPAEGWERVDLGELHTELELRIARLADEGGPFAGHIADDGFGGGYDL